MDVNNTQNKFHLVEHRKIIASPQAKGFTLIELIIVISLVAIIASFASTRWIYGPTLNAQAQQLVADIRYTQSLAMTHDQRYYLLLTAPNTYAISTSGGTAVPDTVTHSNTITFTSGVSFATNLPNNLIAFDEGGMPYTNSAATSALASTATITLTLGSNTRTVAITPAGQVALQ